VAAPVFDEKGGVVAALSVSGPTLRLTPKRIAELRPVVIKHSRALSKQLGHRPEGVHAA
jgi:DNA-binding IclR family transcriptional regulator